MATTPGRTHCVKCGKDKATLKCGGCLQDFCYNHSTEHRNDLSKQLDEVETTRDIFRQTLTDQTTSPQKHALMQQIDKWEHDSIKKIRQTADETREVLLKHTTGYICQIEAKLNRLTDQLRESRQENDFFETDLRQWKEELTQLSEQLINPSNIIIQQDSTPLVTKIYIDLTCDKPVSPCIPKIGINTRWTQNGLMVAGGNSKGSGLDQLNGPYGIYVDDNQTVYIADFNNHRIVEWKCGARNGQVVAGGNGPGNRSDQLNNPTDVIIDKKGDYFIISDKDNRRVVQWPCRNGRSGQTIISNVSCWGLAMDNEGCLYVSDNQKGEVRRWRVGDTSGTVVAGGHGRGNRLDQLYDPRNICIDHDYSVYVSDYSNHRVMKWMKGAKEGIVVAGGLDKGNGLANLSDPNGVIIDHSGSVYVADFDNHRIIRWSKSASQGSIVISKNEMNNQSNQLNYPSGLSIDKQGNLYVVDHVNGRVQKFNIDSS